MPRLLMQVCAPRRAYIPGADCGPAHPRGCLKLLGFSVFLPKACDFHDALRAATDVVAQ